MILRQLTRRVGDLPQTVRSQGIDPNQLPE
ncbi:MAG: DUF4351 domain-containing protein [Goleter apudmare HA4340-LM2]|nr:DUF4351 domain-containing protein [Goleter apudmare HA4340-LM2]